MQLLTFAQLGNHLATCGRTIHSLLSDDFVDGRDIPSAAVDRSGVDRLKWAIDCVRFRRPGLPPFSWTPKLRRCWRWEVFYDEAEAVQAGQSVFL